MSWKPAAIGAAVVLVAGFGVGLAFGGGSPRPTRTVTVMEPASGAGTATRTTPSAHAHAAPVQYLASDSKPNADNVSLQDAPARVRIGRRSYQNSVEVGDIFLNDCASNGMLEYPVDSASATFAGTLGWTIDSDSSASVALEIHANVADGPRLYRHVFTGPEAANVHVSLRGAYKAVFVFVEPSNGCDGDASLQGETFAFGDARFVG